jgi:hypothetical protein
MALRLEQAREHTAEAAGVGPRPRRWLLAYNLAFVLTSAVLVALMGMSYRFLVRTGDTIAPSQAALRQEQEDVLFGSALFFRPVPYKLALYKLRKPDVAVVGSSRAIEFVRRGFTRSMVNLGSMRDLAQVRSLLDSMFSVHRPKLVILTVDFWWFNSARTEEAVDLQADADGQLSLVHLVQPFVWMTDGKIGPGDFIAGALSPTYRPQGIGVAAIYDSAGYDRDGAYDYGGDLRGARPHSDRQFKRTLRRIGETHVHNKFNVRTPLDEARWQSLVEVVGMIEAQGSELILILPPVSKTVVDVLASGGQPILLEEMNARMSGIGHPVFDFHDPTALGSSECEFIDGFHGGRVTHLRMLRAIVHSGRTNLGDYVDVGEIDRLIAENAGYALFKHDLRDGDVETDFLELGCVK